MIRLNELERGPNTYRVVGDGDVGNEIPTRGTGTRDQIPIVVLGQGLHPHRGAVDRDLDGGRGPNPHHGDWDSGVRARG